MNTDKNLEIIKDSKRIDWLSKNPENSPYFQDGLWRIPYLMNGAGGFGGGVGEFSHSTLRGVIDIALSYNS